MSWRSDGSTTGVISPGQGGLSAEADFPGREGGIHRRTDPVRARGIWQVGAECGLVKRRPTRTLGGVRKLLAVIIALAAGGVLLAQEGDAAGRVVVLANADDDESLRIAGYYAKRRGIPEENIIALPMPR